ncbi:MAG: hypothetical protein EA427_00320 [Spirochaetaceae bacterium]|nr:MAG: hypothetical protein EA427_00320 [Spirochaetaceae bacterium]
MKSFRILIRAVMVVVIVALVFPACDMPWDDDDDDDDDKGSSLPDDENDASSPLVPIIGDWEFSAFDTGSEIKFERLEFDYDGSGSMDSIEDFQNEFFVWEENTHVAFLSIGAAEWLLSITVESSGGAKHLLYEVWGKHELMGENTAFDGDGTITQKLEHYLDEVIPQERYVQRPASIPMSVTLDSTGTLLTFWIDGDAEDGFYQYAWEMMDGHTSGPVLFTRRD